MDTDSYMIGLDTHASKCISNSKRQFIGPIRPAKSKKIDDIDGSLEVKGIGTVEWKIQDGQGRNHTIRIPGTLYVPKMEYCILSPQHWIKEAKDHHPKRNGTTTVNLQEGMLMMWNQRRCTKLVPYDPVTNTPRFNVNPGCKQYRAFEAIFNENLQPEEHNICYRMKTRDQQAIPSPTPEEDEELIDKNENLVDFMKGKVKVTKQEEAREELLTPQSELMQ